MKSVCRCNIFLVGILIFLSTAGCIPLLIGAAVGVGGVTYIKGALVKNIDATIEELYDAGLSAFKELDIYVVSDGLDKRSALILGEFANTQHVKVYIQALTERASKITIRVGMIGDQTQSQSILTAIENKL